MRNKPNALPFVNSTMLGLISSIIGEVNEEERKTLNFFETEIPQACYVIAMEKTSLPQAMKWLHVSAEAGYHEAMIAYAALVHACEPDLEYREDEATLWLSLVNDKSLFRGVDIDPTGSRAHRHLVRTLLSGSLSRNQYSVLYKSFFRSGLREVHLLPLISKYLVEETKRDFDEEYRNTTKPVSCEQTSLHSLLDASLLLIDNTSVVNDLNVVVGEEERSPFILLLLPLLLSHLPSLEKLSLCCEDIQPELDLSFLQHTDTSNLVHISIENFIVSSLSTLSLYDISSLKVLQLGSRYSPITQLRSLDGLTRKNTSSLRHLYVSCPDLVDISSLSNCDLSSLESLQFDTCSSLSDLSPLRGLTLSALEDVEIYQTPISDLSPLYECKGLALESLCLPGCPIEDLSFLLHLDLSRFVEPIDLIGTNISDLSPLKSIQREGMSVLVNNTLVELGKEFEFTSFIYVEKVKVFL